ncbi:KICSTOR complex protein ITFG2-like [Liolophura sinensis]|uniref:KICSTOR complex protein ITFG2-like n=1 Tax=Liolophura sinensis TaxID=3198878 RepID=UPI0031587D39
MRAVSFVERLEIDFHGGLFNQAVALGDVDNDKGNELVLGNIEGELAVYKGSKTTPWKKCADLGMITCVGVGDIHNNGKNNVVTLTAEGWCYLFDLSSDGLSEQVGKEYSEDLDRTIQPSFTQHLPANGKTMLMADVDGDGKVELVIGYSDRVVRSFRWHEATGKLQQGGKWQLTGQIGSMTVNLSADGIPELLVAQPGGTFVTLLPQIHTALEELLEEGEDTASQSLVYRYHPLASSRARNSSVTTEIVGCISRGPESQSNRASYYALVTLDGTMMLVEDDRILWSLQVDHQLFSLAKLDVTGNGREEVVVSSWDGQTYIVNHNREVVRYQFEESVAAFHAGHYSVVEGKNVPCFVYVTFSNRIYVYYNLYLPQVESTSLIEAMGNLTETQQLLARLNINTSSTSQLRQLYRWCLYGKHKSPKT